MHGKTKVIVLMEMRCFLKVRPLPNCCRVRHAESDLDWIGLCQSRRKEAFRLLRNSTGEKVSCSLVRKSFKDTSGFVLDVAYVVQPTNEKVSHI